MSLLHVRVSLYELLLTKVPVGDDLLGCNLPGRRRTTNFFVSDFKDIDREWCELAIGSEETKEAGSGDICTHLDSVECAIRGSRVVAPPTLHGHGYEGVGHSLR